MATKTIGIDAEVYEQLRKMKRHSESFTKLLARLADATARPRCVGELLDQLSEFPIQPLTEAEAEVMAASVRESANQEMWMVDPL